MPSTENNLRLRETIRVLFPEGQSAEMKLETYLAGVVGTEMSPNAPIEALKVQAVASRTYAAAAHRHPEAGADVCTTAHCQRWRRIDPTIAPEVFRAVSETWGVVAVHEGKLVDAYYFEHCDGKTRNAEDVLTESLAYLRSVECPCGFVGMRGHGLGLCQRGVVVMARRGASVEQILRHYYRGVSILRAGRTEPSIPKSSAAPRAKAPPRPRKPKRAEPKPPTAAPELPAPTQAEPQPPAPVSPKPAAPPTAAPSQDDSTAALMQELEKLRQLTQSTLREATTDSTIQPAPRQPTGNQTQSPLDLLIPTDSVFDGDASTASAAPSLETAPPRDPLDFLIPPSPLAPDDAASPAQTEEPVAPRVSFDFPVTLPTSAPPSADETRAPRLPLDLPSSPSASDNALVLPRQPREPAASAPPPLIENLETPSQILRRAVIDHLPGERMIAGCLPRADIGIVIEDMDGNRIVTFSGSAPEYGVGGFEAPLEADGRYFVTLGSYAVEVNVTGDTVFIHAENLQEGEGG